MKHESPEGVSYLPPGFPKAPSPPAEQVQCPGNRQGWTGIHQRRHGSRAWTNCPHQSRRELTVPGESEQVPHCYMCSLEPQSPPQVLGAALAVTLTREGTEGCCHPSTSSWLAVASFHAVCNIWGRVPSVYCDNGINLTFSICGWYLPFKGIFPLNIFSIYCLKWLYAAFT